MRNLIGLAVALAVASSAVADVIWDNNIEANGSYARAISPPEFTGNRAADDFDTHRGTLVIGGIRYAGVEDAAWEWADGDGIEVTFYRRHANGGPGDIIATRTPGGSKIATGETFFGRTAYIYEADFEDDPIKLGWARYWVGVRHPTARGSGSNYWLSSDGGPHGGLSHAYFSLDGGNTWQQEVGPDWHHAFVITGEFFCEPCDTNCDGSVDLRDIEPFLRLFHPCSACAGDTNNDGSVDLTDVEGFIECLLR